MTSSKKIVSAKKCTKKHSGVLQISVSIDIYCKCYLILCVIAKLNALIFSVQLETKLRFYSHPSKIDPGWVNNL